MERSRQEAATAYWHLLEESFPPGSKTHTAFYQLLETFTRGSISYATFLSVLKGFFRGHEHLITELEKLFPSYGNHPKKVEPKPTRKNDSTTDYYGRPRGNKIWETKNPIRRTSACQEFLRDIRKRLNDDQIYRSFLELMTSYQLHKDLDRLDEEVKILFRETPEFYVEFTVFLADAKEAEHREEEKIRERLNAGKDKVAKGIKKRKSSSPEPTLTE